jgi:biopolymer transport protein ExbD
MNRAAYFASVALLGWSGSIAQSGPSVVVRISAHQTCLIGDVEVACRSVGAKLLEMHVPVNTDVHVSGDASVKYEIVHATMESLRQAGFKTKVGLITTGGS